MGTSLTGLTPATTYDALIKVGDNGPLSATAKVLSDGLGNDSILALSTTAVGIGTTTPSTRLSIVDNSPVVVGSSSGSISVTEETGTTLVGQGGGIFLGIPASSGSFLSTFIRAARETTDGSNSASSLLFGTRASGGANTERMRITSDGYLRMAASTGGIQFNGDTAAANALDDYEEGTWTPVLSFGFGDTGLTYNARSGTYTKIGRKVTLNGYIALSNKGTSTGACRIGAFPFTCASGDNFLSAISMWFNNISFTGQYQGLVRTNTNYSDLGNVSEAGTFVTLTDTNFTTNSEIIMCITYFV